MNQISIRGQQYEIESVSDLLIALSTAALEQGLLKPSTVSAFGYFLKSCCPSIPDKYCRILGFSPTGEPIFSLSLDSDEVVSLQSAITIFFLKQRIQRLEDLKADEPELSQKISDQIASISQAISLVEQGLKRITVEALVESAEIVTPQNAGPSPKPTMKSANNVLPANATIDRTVNIRKQIEDLQGQLKQVETIAS